MRNINSTALAKIATEQGTRPMNFIEIQWQNGTVTRYGDKAITGVNPKIIQMSTIEEIISLAKTGGSSTCSVTLDDTDGTIKALMDVYPLHKRPCTIYQHFEDLPISDAFPILYGQIVSPIEWDRDSRTVTFNVVTQIHSGEVGFAIEEGQYANIVPELIGVVWPVGFGGVVHAPATKIGSARTGTTMSLFGFPDVTLQFRQKMLQNDLSKLQYAFETYIMFGNYVKEQIPLPLDIQDAYIALIKEEDDLKQAREDRIYSVEKFNKQIDAMIEEYYNLDEEASDYDTQKQDILDRIEEVKKERDKIMKLIKDFTDRLSDIEFEKKASEVDGENEKYIFGVIGSLRTKIAALIQDYGRINREIALVQEAMLQQQQFLSNQVLISGGEYFPQNVPIYVNFGGMLILGVMEGRTFTIDNFVPCYTNVVVGPKIDDKKDTFYIVDPNIQLQGKYCLLTSGDIIKVTSQEHKKCTFQLLTDPANRRMQKRPIQYSGQNASEINAGLGNILTGDETIEEINFIINTFPRDLSKEAWKKLVGQNNKQKIKMYGTPTNGTWTISVDENESLPIPLNATAQDVDNALHYLPSVQNFLNSGNGNNNPSFTVTGGPLDKDHEITVTFNKMPMPILKVDSQGLCGDQIIRMEDTAASGTFTFQISNVSVQNASGSTVTIPPVIVPWDASAALINSNLNQYSQVVTFSGGVFPDDPLTVHFLDPNATIEIVDNSLLKANGKKAYVFVAPEDEERPFITAYTDSTGAHEHTTKEIDSLLKNVVGKGEFGTNLKKARKAMLQAYNEMRDAMNDDGLTDDDYQVIKKAFYETVKEYWGVIKKIYYAKSVMEEAYAPISQHEYKHLFEMEVYHYLEWVRSMTPIDVTDDNTEKYFLTGFNVVGISEVSPAILPQWVSSYGLLDEYALRSKIDSLPSTDPWINQVGSQCVLNANFQEKYVVNTLPSTITGVYGRRSIKGVGTLVPIPSRYYVKNESENFGLFNATTITLVRPLSDFVDEQWEDVVFVSYTSSIGPNTADIIKHIVENYTNLTMDTDSYNHVKTVLANYPQNFVINEQRNALDLIKDIAWQARCMIDLKGQIVRLVYLAETPDPVDTITNDDIIFGSFKLFHTETEDINTKMVATWKPSLHLDKENKIILRHNVSRYGLSEEVHNFFTYNIYDLVYKSATFWMIRNCNSWKMVAFKCPLTKLNLEMHDCITLDVGNDVSSGPVNGIIQKAVYDSSSNSVDFEVLLPIRMGEMTPYDFFWPAGISINNYFPKITDIISGYAGNPINSSVPSGNPYDPNDPSLLIYRPKTYGQIKVSDHGDELPKNPALDFKELDYNTTTTYTSPSTSGSKQISDDREVEKDLPSNETHAETNRPKNDSDKDWNNIEPTFSAFGRVIEYDSEKSGTETDMPEKADSDAEVTRQFYKVRLTDGRLVSVRQMQIAKDSRIPGGTMAYVSYDKHQKEFQMQVPVFLWPDSVT